jgi:hypothetical protein
MMWERACFRLTPDDTCDSLVMLMNSMLSGVGLLGATLAISLASCPDSMMMECKLVAIASYEEPRREIKPPKGIVE